MVLLSVRKRMQTNQYTTAARPGKVPALHTHLKVAADLFHKHGFGVLDFWTEEIGTAFRVLSM